MKKFILSFVLALGASALPAGAATISLDYTAPIAPGSFFDVFVNITGVFDGRSASDALLAYGFNVTVADPSIVSFQSAEVGPLFDDFSAFFGGNPAVVGIATNPLGLKSGDFSEPLTLAILHFAVNGVGTTNIGITADPTDLNQGLVYLDEPYGAISASTSVTATPEPAMLTLMSLMLMALYVVYARRRA